MNNAKVKRLLESQLKTLEEMTRLEKADRVPHWCLDHVLEHMRLTVDLIDLDTIERSHFSAFIEKLKKEGVLS